jgi:hypothetical protein
LKLKNNLSINQISCLYNLLFKYNFLLKKYKYFCPFALGYCVVCPSIYDFWLPLWVLETFLIKTMTQTHFFHSWNKILKKEPHININVSHFIIILYYIIIPLKSMILWFISAYNLLIDIALVRFSGKFW